MTPDILISFIIPAHNAASFLADAVNSVIRQTHTNWELIIIDDNSSDSTLSIANDFANVDDRILVLSRKQCSGGAFIPRYEGILAAKGDFILPLDADDLILPDYAAKLLESLFSLSNSPYTSLAYPAEYLWIPPFNAAEAFHPSHFILEDKLVCTPGSQAVKLTLNGWRVAAAGGVIPRKIYLESYRKYGVDHANLVYADEILTRYLLWHASTVVYTNPPIYYCRTHSESITTKPSLRRLDILKAGMDLITFSKDKFGIASEEYRLANMQLFHWCFDSAELLSNPFFSRNQRRRGYRLIQDARRHIDIGAIRSYVSKKLLMLLPLPIPVIRQLLKLRKSSSL